MCMIINRKIVLGLLSLIALSVPMAGKAQKGEKYLGLTGGYATYNQSGYMGVDFQYTIIDHLRIAPDIVYSFKNNGKSAFILDLDMQFPFRLARGFKIYPLIGLAYNRWSFSGDTRVNRVGGNIGAGFDFYMTSNLKLSVQGKYSVMKDTGGGFLGMGIGYIF